jgi:NAD(P) transhydrogenase subunit alpha
MAEITQRVAIGVPRETFANEQRVAIVPDVVAALRKMDIAVLIESGAGQAAGHTDADYSMKGAVIAGSRADVFSKSDIILQVRSFGANVDAGRKDLELFRKGQTLIGFAEPLTSLQEIKAIAEHGVNLFAMELIPRISRAQSMDALSSMATVAGYKAVLLAAASLPKMFPLLMTAAGTVSPAHVFVIGVGVAGLQAIATAKRLGAMVKAFDVRPAVKDQVQSLGATFVELEIEASQSEDKGGYARAMDEEFYRKQRELMAKVVAESDAVITTAAVPGKKAPVLVTEEMVKKMSPGSVIVDLASERGGNCELTKDGARVVVHGVTILGPSNLPSSVPYHSSQLYSKNLLALLKHLIKDGKLQIDVEDEIARETLVTSGGEVVHARVRELIEGSATAQKKVS